MRLHLIILFIVALTANVLAQDLKPLTERLAAQNALFDEQYESDLRAFPERATAFGDYRYNDKLADRSLAAIVGQNQTDERFVARLKAIPPKGFSGQVLLAHGLLVRFLEQLSADFELKEHEM